MGILFSSDIEGLDDLLINGLKTTGYAEQQIIDALPKMIDKTSDQQLKACLDHFLSETRNRATRLDQAFSILGIEADQSACAAIDGILKAVGSNASDIDDASTRDAAIAFGVQMACHYGITHYGTMTAWAKELGMQDIAEILAESDAECRATDQELTTIAETRVNKAAQMRGDATTTATADAGTDAYQRT